MKPFSSGARAVARAVSIACAAALLAACSAAPSIQTGADAETIMDGRLSRVDNTQGSLVYVDPDADYARYRRVFVAPLNVDHIEIVQPGRGVSAVSRVNRDWELDDEDRSRLQQEFAETVRKAIKDGGSFAIADARGEDVIVIDAMITQIAPTAPRDDVQSRGTRSTIITEGAGSISVAIVLADGDSGEALAIIKDTRDGQSGFGTINNRVTNLAELRRHFRSWGTQLSDGLLALRERAGG